MNCAISAITPYGLRIFYATTLCALWQAAAAQGAPAAEPVALEEVTIVGSRAKSRTVFDSTVPTDVLSGRSLEQGLATGELGQALQNLTPSINMPRASSSGTSDSVRVIQLRGLSPDQALILINGKRRHLNAVMDTEGLFPGTVSVDLNTIPTSSIESVEILRDGAGAQYGSDAIAGVVNINLKRKPSGGGATVSYGANHTFFSPTGQRITDGQTVAIGLDRGFALGEGGFFHVGGDLLRKSGTNRSGPTDAGFASHNATAADLTLDGQALFKSGDSSLRNGSLFYNAALPLSGGLQAYSFATAARRQSRGGAFYRYPGDASNVSAIYPHGYRPETVGRTSDLGWVGGIKHEGEVWSLDGSARVGVNHFEYGVENSLNASLGAGSPTEFHLARYAGRQASLNLDANRTLDFAGFYEPATWAVGLESMRETYRSSAGDAASYAAGSLTSSPPGAQAGPGLRPEDAVKVSRNVHSLYTDLDIPITERLLMGAAARQSHYEDAGNATTGKFSGRYKITPSWLVRGSVSNSFRAPALAQTAFRTANLNFNGTGTGLQNNLLLPAGDPLAQAFGASKLNAERSNNVSLGTAWKPSRDGTLTIDVYRIGINGRIARSSDLQSPAVSSYLASVGRSDVGSVAFLTNAVDTTTHGIDIVGTQDIRLDQGRLRLTAALNFNRTRVNGVHNNPSALAAIDPSLDLLNPASLLQLERGSPRNKLVITGEWANGPWNTLVRATRYGEIYVRSFDSSAPVVGGTNAQKFSANLGVDVEVQYQFSKGVTLAVGGNNIFDRYPQRTLAGGTYGGAFPYDYANPIGINGAFYYVRAKLAF